MVDQVYEDRLTEMLSLMNYEVTETNVEQLRVYMEAMQVFVDRNEQHGDLWKQYGAEDNMLHMRSKMARTEQSVKLHGVSADAQLLDSPIDLINYSVFFIRNARGV